MYYRIFAAQFLPRELDRILYLDPDVVAINSLNALYNIDFQENLFAAATDVYEPLEKLNRVRLKMPKNSTYVNSGVMMLNLSPLREQQNIDEVFDYIQEYKNRLIFPDQDVINGLYGGRTIIVDPKIYNLSERYYIIAVVPDSSHKPIVYATAVIADSKNKQDAEDYLKYLQSPEGQQVFIKYGFKTMSK